MGDANVLRKKVLIVWEHGGNLGHLSRLLPVALALRQAGYDVVFSVADVSSARRYLGALHFDFVMLPRIVLLVAHESGALNHADVFLKAGFGEAGRAKLCIRQWHDLFKSVKPAAVLVDSSPFALYAARSAGVPALAIGHGFEIPPSQGARPCFTPWVENAVDKAKDLESRLHQAFEDLSQSLPVALRLNAPKSVDDLFQPHQAALCTWPEFDHFDRKIVRTGMSSAYVGPIWANALTSEKPNWSEDDGPKVLCYLNLRDKRYDFVWQALKQHGANVLVISPHGVPGACEAARGWGIQIIENPVLLDSLMRNCDAVVGHGGMGLTSLALHRGKRTLLLPEHMEQAILAYRLSKQGLATATIKFRDKSLIQKKVTELLTSDVLKHRAKSFSEVHCHYLPNEAVQLVVSSLVNLTDY